jgi:hypothetical protein
VVEGEPWTCGDGSCGDEWYVYLSRCFFADQSPFQLVRYDAQITAAVQDLEVRLLAPPLSSFGGTAPGWRLCSNNPDPTVSLHPFATGWETALIINSSVRTEEASWSSVKARF